jgi:hypothetical protein
MGRGLPARPWDSKHTASGVTEFHFFIQLRISEPLLRWQDSNSTRSCIGTLYIWKHLSELETIAFPLSEKPWVASNVDSIQAKGVAHASPTEPDSLLTSEAQTSPLTSPSQTWQEEPKTCCLRGSNRERRYNNSPESSRSIGALGAALWEINLTRNNSMSRHLGSLIVCRSSLPTSRSTTRRPAAPSNLTSY